MGQLKDLHIKESFLQIMRGYMQCSVAVPENDEDGRCDGNNLKPASSSATPDPDASLPDCHNIEYLEPQEVMKCGRHAINNLLGGPHTNDDELNQIAKDVLEHQQAIIDAAAAAAAQNLPTNDNSCIKCGAMDCPGAQGSECSYFALPRNDGDGQVRLRNDLGNNYWDISVIRKWLQIIFTRSETYTKQAVTSLIQLFHHRGGIPPLRTKWKTFKNYVKPQI